MKRLQCEICGSNELRKDGGVFVCQACGCQYTVEEARKMMVEGVVEVQGTVSIDNTVDVQGTVMVDNASYVAKYLANARRAKEKEDWEEVERYYNMVEQNDPDNIEAIFYSAYGKAMQSLVDSDIYKREAAFRVFTNSITVVDDHYRLDRWEENKESLTQMAMDIARMVSSGYVFTRTVNGYGTTASSDSWKTTVLFERVLSAFKESIDNIKHMDPHRYLYEIAAALYETTKQFDWGSESEMGATLSGWLDDERRGLQDFARIDNALYWKLHGDERVQLDAELKRLRMRESIVASRIEKSPECAAVDELKRRIAETKRQLSDTRGARRNRRAQLTEEIAGLASELKVATEKKSKATVAMRAELHEIRLRADAIETRLNEASLGDDSELLSDVMREHEGYFARYVRENPKETYVLRDAKQEIVKASQVRKDHQKKRVYHATYIDRVQSDDKAIAECNVRIDNANRMIGMVRERAEAAFLDDEIVKLRIEEAKRGMG